MEATDEMSLVGPSVLVEVQVVDVVDDAKVNETVRAPLPCYTRSSRKDLCHPKVEGCCGESSAS